MYYQLSIINWLQQHQLPCIFKKVTHFDCPGCGFQRSFIELLKGDVGESFRLYPALMPMLLFFTFLILNNKFYIASSTKITKIGIASIFIIILVSYIIKIIL
jgi:hypothetical protein